MTLTKLNDTEFYKNEIEVEILLEGDFDTFRDYSEVFFFFTKFDNLYNDFKSGYSRKDIYFIKKLPKTKVVSVSKGSLVIGAFIEQHWLELLLFFISVNFTDIRKNVKSNLLLFDDLIDQIEIIIKEITADFPELERDKLIEIIRQFENLSDDFKESIMNQIRRARKVLRKIKKIIKR